MPRRNSSTLSGLEAFVTVARQLSYSKAATRLGVTNSAVSQAVRAFEDAIGVKLVNRTTRKVALTTAGEQLLEEAGRGLDLIEQAVLVVGSRSRAPGGRLRINASRLAIRLVVTPHLAAFHAAHPQIELELCADDVLVDISDDAFDAGIRAGRTLAPGMVAKPLGPMQRLVVVGAPAYLGQAGIPDSPEALLAHRCIRFRVPGRNRLRPWSFASAGAQFDLQVAGGLIVNDSELALRAALAGAGLSQQLLADVAPALRSGELVQVLGTHACDAGRYHIYYPSRRHVPARLRAFVDFLVERNAVPDAPAESARSRAKGSPRSQGVPQRTRMRPSTRRTR